MTDSVVSQKRKWQRKSQAKAWANHNDQMRWKRTVQLLCGVIAFLLIYLIYVITGETLDRHASLERFQQQLQLDWMTQRAGDLLDAKQEMANEMIRLIGASQIERGIEEAQLVNVFRQLTEIYRQRDEIVSDARVLEKYQCLACSDLSLTTKRKTP